MINSFYFSHDFNARNDPKIKRLFMRHGVCGYGLFWAIIEDLYQNANALPTDYESIAFDLRSDCETVKSVINDFGLFVITENIFYSDSVQKRLDARNEKIEKAKKSAQARWGDKAKDEISEGNANALDNDANAMLLKERKGKEIKENEIILKKEGVSEISKNEISTPSQDEIIIDDIPKKEKKEKAPQTGGADEKKVWGEWKDGQGDGELHELLKDYFLNPNSPRYEAVEYQKFKAYWTAKVLSGRQKGKELWRTKETFSIAGRLSTWNQNKQNGSTSTGGKYQKVIPLTPTGIEPQNGRRFGKL